MNVFSLFENAVAAWGDRTAVRYGARLLDILPHSASRRAIAWPSSCRTGSFIPPFRGGYVAVPINAKLHPSEVGYIVENAATKAIVVDSDALEGVAAAAPSLRSEDFIVAGTPYRPGNLDALLRRKTANAAIWRSAIPTIPPGCSTPRARPDDPKAPCSATAISSRWR